MDLVVHRPFVFTRDRHDADSVRAEAILQRLLDRAGGDLDAEHVDDIGDAPAQRQPSVRRELAHVARIEITVAKELARRDRVVEIAFDAVVDSYPHLAL